MSPAEEAKFIQQEIAHAQAVGDISAILSLMTRTAELTPDDFMEKTIGATRYLYYVFLDKFQQRPRDMTDLVDGILYLENVNYVKKREISRLKAEQTHGK